MGPIVTETGEQLSMTADRTLAIVGASAQGSDAVAVRGDLDAREFIAFWHRDGVVTAAMTVNAWGLADDLESVVGSGKEVDLDRLSDRNVALGDLV
jgi:3-phenylpropionate/trans-cinnamate dioxygenase ferredoxin reductase subunit